METVNIGKYELREPVVGDAPELFELMTGGEVTDMRAIINGLLRNCVYVDGSKLGERINEVPLRELGKIVSELVRMAGVTEKK